MENNSGILWSIGLSLVLFSGCPPLGTAGKLELTTVSPQNSARNLIDQYATRALESLIYTSPAENVFSSNDIRPNYTVRRDEFRYTPTQLYVQREAAAQICTLVPKLASANNALAAYLDFLRHPTLLSTETSDLLSPFSMVHFSTATLRRHLLERDWGRVRVFSLRSTLRLLQKLERAIPGEIREELNYYSDIKQQIEEIAEKIAEAQSIDLKYTFDPDSLVENESLYGDAFLHSIRRIFLTVLRVIDEFQGKYIRDITKLIDLKSRYGDQEFLSERFLGEVQSRLTSLAAVQGYEITWGNSIFDAVKFKDVSEDPVIVLTNIENPIQAQEDRISTLVPTISVETFCQEDLPGLIVDPTPTSDDYRHAILYLRQQLSQAAGTLGWLRSVELQDLQ